MNEDLNDILYDIDMQLYDEFNDKIATMNDYLGDIYSLRDIEEVENAQKEKEIQLLRVAVTRLENKIKKIKQIVDIYNNTNGEFVTLPNGEEICLSDNKPIIAYLQEILEEEN